MAVIRGRREGRQDDKGCGHGIELAGGGLGLADEVRNLRGVRKLKTGERLPVGEEFSEGERVGNGIEVLRDFLIEGELHVSAEYR